MSRVLSIALIALYGLTLSQAYMPQVNYWMNRDYIASVLCENKDKPELECNGQCHLKKQIKEQSDKEKEGEEVSERLMVEFIRAIDEFAVVVEDETHEIIPSYYCDNLDAGVKQGIFHPPKLLI